MGNKEEKDTMREGQVFSSMAAVPLLASEPFNITVSSPSCEVYILSGRHIDRIPDSALEELRNCLRQDMLKRVKTLCIRAAHGREPMQSPRATGFPDWREAPCTAHRTAISRASSLPS